MGQGASTGGGPEEEGSGPDKQDFYEALGVDRQASGDDIKRAYRKKALELHPDRNYGKVEEATRLFAAVQSAYEVLSDPQERAWYDSHRDVLLRGNDPQAKDKPEYSYNVRMTTAEEVTQLMLKFNGRLEMSDAPSGFFGGLREFFEKLTKEEEIACNWEGLDTVEYPTFGHKDDEYHTVVRPFYAAWNGFATRKTYSWRDAYRLSEAPDRRVRRLMEKENRRLREDAIREFNDSVRSLIAFVRKRDARYQENVKSEAERQKTLRDAASAQAARSRATRQAQMKTIDKHELPEWARPQPGDASSTGDEEEEGSEEEEHFNCVACNKIFKSERQFEAHERSKKHIKLLKQLRKDMNQDDTAIQFDHAQPGQRAQSSDRQAYHSGTEEKGEVTIGDNPPSDSEQPGSPGFSGHDELAQSTKGEDSDSTVPEAHEQTRVSSSSSEMDSDYAPRDSLARVDLPLRSLATPDSHGMGNIAAKPGKAKQKRAKKEARQATADKGRKSCFIKCASCQAEFPSKTKLFNHIKDYGHAQPVAKPAGTVGKSRKK